MVAVPVRARLRQIVARQRVAFSSDRASASLCRKPRTMTGPWGRVKTGEPVMNTRSHSARADRRGHAPCPRLAIGAAIEPAIAAAKPGARLRLVVRLLALAGTCGLSLAFADFRPESGSDTAAVVAAAESSEADPARGDRLNLPRIRVEGEEGRASLSVTDETQARTRLAAVPGGTAVIGEALLRRAATGDLAAMIGGSPGLFLQSRFGGDEVRLSIRGSGITQTFGIRGVRVLRDGIPVTGAGGFTNPELIELASARFIEVYRGANALQFGGAELGGAINLVSHTGYSSDRLRLRVEGGSHDYLRTNISGGGVSDNGLDGFFSLATLHQDGFREQAHQRTWRSYSNLGFRFNENNESRLHLNLQQTSLELPGPLRLSQVLDNPNQANGFWRANRAQRDLDLYRLAWQHGTRLGTGELRFGAWVGRTELDHPLPFVVIFNDTDDHGAQFRHDIEGRLGALPHRLTWGLQSSFEQIDGRQFAPAGGGIAGDLQQRSDSEAWSIELFGESRTRILPELDLIVGAQAAFTRREAFIDFNNQQSVDIDEAKRYNGFSPKLGLLWRAAADTTLFANLSASHEPPSLQDFGNENDPDPNARATLRPQQAVTVEVGGRGRWHGIDWDLALYRATIDREILLQETSPGSGQSFATNADDTIHAGIELGLGGEVPLDDRGRHSLVTRLSYTHNRLRFDGDARFGDNDLPGLPRNFGRLELYYRSGEFEIGPSFEAADRTQIDFANTLSAPGYGIWNASASWTPDPRLRLFVEVRNLADKAFVSNTGITANANGTDGNFFNPGLTRSVFGGIEARL
jgi:iron complex outermembrane receptor protein